jgi:hypothetical protein
MSNNFAYELIPVVKIVSHEQFQPAMKIFLNHGYGPGSKIQYRYLQVLRSSYKAATHFFTLFMASGLVFNPLSLRFVLYINLLLNY